MLSVVKPLQEFGKLDKCLSRYGTRFEFNNEKQVIFSSDVNSEDTFVILEGVISLRREENVLIGITQAPYIMGLADGVMKNDIPYKLISEGNCTGYHLPAKQTITLIEQKSTLARRFLLVSPAKIEFWNYATCSSLGIIPTNKSAQHYYQ